MLGALILSKKGALNCKACQADEAARKRTCRLLKMGKISKADADKVLTRRSLMEQRGCKDTPGHTEFWWPPEFGGGPLERCPLSLISECEWYPEFFDAWMFWRENVFPIHGGWADQCGLLVSGIKFIESELHEMRGNS